MKRVLLIICVYIFCVAPTVTSAALKSPAYISQFGSNGTGQGQFKNVADIKIDSSGYIYTVETGNRFSETPRIQKFDADGVYQSSFGTFGTGDGELNRPRSIVLDGLGNIYVTDSGNHRVQKFRISDGAYLSKFGIEGAGDGEFSNPSFIDRDSSGNLYVVDRSNNRVQKINDQGTYVSQFSVFGPDDPTYNSPQGITVNSLGTIYVSNDNGHNVNIFNSSGAYQAKIGTGISSGADGEFSTPSGMTHDSLNNIYVVDNGRFQKLTSNGTYISSKSGNGSGDGEFSGAISIAVNETLGRIYVADSGNARIQIFTNPSVGATLSQSSLSPTEGATTTYTVVLTAEPEADVTINVESSNPSIASVSSSTLTYTSLDYNVPQTITVTAIENDRFGGANTATISHTVTSSDTDYASSTIASISVTITDNDTAPTVTASSAPQPASRSGGNSRARNAISRVASSPIVSTAPSTRNIVPGCPSGVICTPIPKTEAPKVIVPNTPNTTSQSSLNRSLTLASTGSDVKKLQQLLNAQGFTIAAKGPGSPGSETEYFGTKTREALMQFQKAKGITPASGYFGPITQKYLRDN